MDDISAYPDSLISLTVAGPAVKRRFRPRASALWPQASGGPKPEARGRSGERRAERHAEQALVRRACLVAAHAVFNPARRGHLTGGRDGRVDPALVGLGRGGIEPE